MEFKKYYIVANTREEFKNESQVSIYPYNDHPSQRSIHSIISELEQLGYITELFGGIDELIDAYQCHRTFSNTLFLNFSDGLNQISRKAQSAMLLELLNVPYAGSDPLSRLIAGNKFYSKRIISHHMKVPKGTILFKNMLPSIELSFPVIIKPNREGSSIGITQKSICHNLKEAKTQVASLLTQFNEILIEEYIPGYEITCFIIGNRDDYYLIEPIVCEYDGISYFKNFVFGIEEKSTHKRKEYLAHNFFNPKIVEKIITMAQTSFELLNMKDFARVDFRLSKEGELFFIEINGNAVISETSEIGVLSHELKLNFGTIIEYIIRAATNRYRLNRG